MMNECFEYKRKLFISKICQYIKILLESNIMLHEKTDEKSEKERVDRRRSCVDSILEILPEIHIIGYNFCGINTNLEKRLALNQQGVNELDCACRTHDISYSESKNLEWRLIADKKLVLSAVKRIYAKNAKIGERIAALIVSSLIGIKMILSKIEICIHTIRMCLNLKFKRKTITKQKNEY